MQSVFKLLGCSTAIQHAWRWSTLGHRGRFLLLATVIFLAGQAPLLAQSGSWPTYPLPSTHSIDRGPGFYLSGLKLLALWLMFLLWVKIVDWVSNDCQEHEFSHALWVPVVFAPFFVFVFLIGLTVPIFGIGGTVCGLAVLVPSLVYVFWRNKQVELHERVLTKDHIRFLLSQRLSGISAEAKAAHEKGAAVTFEVLSGKEEERQAKLILARQSAGFLATKQLIANAVDHRADKVMLDFAAANVTSRYQVDGVWHDSDSHEREEGDNILGVLKTLAALKPEERRARQTGKFQAKYEKRKIECGLVSQGTKSGERVILSFGGQAGTFGSLLELGMREKMLAQLKDVMLSENGIICFSAMQGGGLTTTFTTALKSTDRLLRDFLAIEDEHKKLPEVENVDPVFFDGSKGETPFAQMDKVLRKQPDVLVIPELMDTQTIQKVCDSAHEHLYFITIVAKEAVEALLRILLMKVPAKSFAPRAVAVLNQRLVRKLCESCKEPYEPPPTLLKKLGIPAGRVDLLYRHPENPEKVCPDCHGIGYFGRTAIFELLVVDDTIREALIKQPKLDILRKTARKAGNRNLQDEGILAVVQGVTSLPELMRVLKQ